MAGGFQPDTTPPGTAPMPLAKPLPAPKAPSLPKGPGASRTLNPKQKKRLAIQKRQGGK